METLIFIDTNIFLDFYRDRGRDGITQLLGHVNANHDKIITGDQVEMEYKKNRQSVIQQAAKQVKEPDWSCAKIPPIMQDAKITRGLERAKKAARQSISRINRKLDQVLRNPDRHDEIYKLAHRLFDNKNDLNLSRDKKIRIEIRELAQKRCMLGYPPRKATDTSIGDAINWEWIIKCCQTRKANVVIVSRDSDYGITSPTPIINDWLKEEFKDRTTRKRNVTLTDRLTVALKMADIKVSKSEESDEEQLLNSLRDLHRQIIASNALSSGGPAVAPSPPTPNDGTPN